NQYAGDSQTLATQAASTVMTYTAGGRLKQITDGRGNVTEYSYGLSDNTYTLNARTGELQARTVTQKASAGGQDAITRTDYDGFGQKTAQRVVEDSATVVGGLENGNELVTHYRYDLQGNLIKLTRPQSQRWLGGVGDNPGGNTEAVTPVETYQYDFSGNRIRQHVSYTGGSVAAT
ncbi:hypothetical protein, partial [Parachitinimonas caeni]